MAPLYDAQCESQKIIFRANIPAYVLTLLPASLGFAFIWFGILYAGGLRPVIFELSWLLFAFVVVAISITSNAPVIEEAKKLSRPYLAVFGLFACVWAYTTIFVAPSSRMANYASGIGVTAILVGLAAAALKRRFGNRVAISTSWSLFVAMLLHAPFLIWLYVLEGQNPDFNWSYQLPGYPGLRMYNYSVEAGIAAGLGLFFLTDRQDKLKRLLLVIGVTLLWVLLFWSGGRGAFFALFATTVFVAFIVPKFVHNMWKFFFATTTLGAGFSLLLPVPSNNFGIMSRIDRTINSGSINEISSNRLTIWSDAYNIFLDRPIFGHGIAQYRHLTSQVALTAHDHVHNILLESLISFGLVGTAVLIFLLGKIWGTAALRLRGANSPSTLPVFFVATTLLAHGFVSGTYYHIHSVIMIAISLGFLLQNDGNSRTANGR